MTNLYNFRVVYSDNGIHHTITNDYSMDYEKTTKTVNEIIRDCMGSGYQIVNLTIKGV